MDTNSERPDSGSHTAENDAQPCHPASKWAAIANDQHVLAPERRTKVSVIKAQAGIPNGHTLFRDFTPASDVPLMDDEILDLAAGNVFYSRKGCFERSVTNCNGKPKLAWFVDDHHEVTLRSDQTAKALRELFSIPPKSCIIRDYDSPSDDQIGPDATVEFEDGPVFITRCSEPEEPIDITIIVNTRDRHVFQKSVSFEDIVALAFENPSTGPNFCYTIDYRNGPACNPQGEMFEGGPSVTIKKGMIFNVTLTDKS